MVTYKGNICRIYKKKREWEEKYSATTKNQLYTKSVIKAMRDQNHKTYRK